MVANDLLKGTLRTIVLKLLADNGRMYGYEITQKVKDMTDAKIQITEGALYPTLHALEKQGDVITEKIYIGKRVRKYYILTDQGKKTVAERVNELADFMKTMRFLLDLDSSVQNV